MAETNKDIEPAEDAVELVVYALEMAVAELEGVARDRGALQGHWVTLVKCHGRLGALLRAADEITRETDD